MRLKVILTVLAMSILFACPVFAAIPRVYVADPTSEQGATVINNALDINQKPASSVISGQTAVTTAGTEVPLASSTAILSVTVKAKHANTNMIYVGKNPVTSSTGFVLDAGEAVSMDVDNLADVYIDSDTNGEGVSYIAVIK